MPSTAVLSSTQRAQSMMRGLRAYARIITNKMSGNEAKSSPVRIISESTLLLK